MSAVDRVTVGGAEPTMVVPNGTITTPLLPPSLDPTQFYILHVSATMVLSITCIISTGLLTHSLALTPSKFASRNIVERLVVYLSISDFGYSLPLIIGHVHLLIHHAPIHHIVCCILGGIVCAFFVAQVLLIASMAVNTFLLVVWNTRIDVGPADWKLLLVVFGSPLACVIILAPFKVFGPGEQDAWCGTASSSKGMYLGVGFAILFLLILIINIISYLSVCFKLRHNSSSSISRNKYDQLSRTLVVFVFAYLISTGPVVIHFTTSLFMQPPFIMVWAVVFFPGLSGFINFVAYSVLRRHFRNCRTQSPPVSV